MAENWTQNVIIVAWLGAMPMVRYIASASSACAMFTKVVYVELAADLPCMQCVYVERAADLPSLAGHALNST